MIVTCVYYVVVAVTVVVVVVIIVVIDLCYVSSYCTYIFLERIWAYSGLLASF